MASTFEWRCELDGVELGSGSVPTWAEALRAAERAAGWDRDKSPSAPASCKARAVILVKSPGSLSWLALGWVV